MGNSKSKKGNGKAVNRKPKPEAGVRDSQFSMGFDSSQKKLGVSWKEISTDNFNDSGEDLQMQNMSPLLSRAPLKKQETVEYDDLPPPPKPKLSGTCKRLRSSYCELIRCAGNPEELAKVSGELEVFLLRVDPSRLGDVKSILETYQLEGREGLNQSLMNKYGQSLDTSAEQGREAEGAKKPQVPARLKVAKPGAGGASGNKAKSRRPSALAYKPVAAPVEARQDPRKDQENSDSDDGNESDEESDDEDALMRKKSSIVPPFASKPRENSMPEFMRPSNGAVRKLSQGSGKPRRTSQVSAHSRPPRRPSQVSVNSRQHSVMSAQSANIEGEGETEDGKNDPRRPTKFGKAILPANVMAEFAQKGNQKPRDVSELERKVSVQKQRKLSYMSQESANIEEGAGTELQQKLAKARKMSMKPPEED